MDYKIKAVIVDAAGFQRTITRLAHEIIERNRGTEKLGFVGMQTRGVFLARRLAAKVEQIEGIRIPVGVLDTTMYRDDYRTALKQPQVQITEIPFDLLDMNVVLVDDVLYTGRTVRAALDALMDFGRPRRIQLAVLVDRGHRELPIKPDFVGKNVPTSVNEEVRVRMTEIDSEDTILLVEVPAS
ncbi:bifunctional pyr operon transcriptional regulator/uracil phosphoribosyltransferase PyrR [bacterium]|nr:bifunctional pyr operon transcriptional regulator/uracil phosphoribosyltransferase PyrR [bacterium]MBU1983353.1 bifunctional pyr operon transcriptional regulator/uracil phosphoribosyltransferase PyrR [bacterium]